MVVLIWQLNLWWNSAFHARLAILDPRNGGANITCANITCTNTTCSIPRAEAESIVTRVVAHDGTCHETPRILHHTSYAWKKTLAKLERRGRGRCVAEQNALVIRDDVARVHFEDCNATELTAPGVSPRHCNGTFLLSRALDGDEGHTCPEPPPLAAKDFLVERST